MPHILVFLYIIFWDMPGGGFFHQLFLFWSPLLGYSSGSAGGPLLGEENTNAPEPTGSPTATPPPVEGPPVPEALGMEPEVLPPTDPEPPAADTKFVGRAMTLDDMEAQLKSRMERHAWILETQLEKEFLQKKRKAEAELDDEMDLRRQKRLRDLEEEIKEEMDMKNAKLASLSTELAERMELVVEEQKLLDDLKEKAINMQQMLEEEAKKFEVAKAATANAKAMGATPVRADNNTALKDRLKEKLEQTMSRTRTTPTNASQSQTPSPLSQATTPPTVPPAEEKIPNKDRAIVPTTDMRFTSSTHPGAWQFLYRITKKDDQCDKEIYDAWHAGAWAYMLTCYL